MKEKLRKKKKKKLKRKVKIIGIILIIILLVIIPILAFHFSEIHLKLNGENKIILNLNEEYKEPGIKGNILFFTVNNIQTENNIDSNKIGTYKVSYKAKFLYKKKQIERIVEVVDNINPEITLLGDSLIKLYVNMSYKDPGYKASDNIDGDLTDKVIINDKLDLKTVGTYKIIYEVSDSNNNKATAERTIEVMPRPLKNASSIPVLMYHFFYDKEESNHSNDGNWTEVSLFEEEVKYLVENNYYFPTWQEVIDYLDKKITLPEKSVVITADDSDPSFFKYAVPIIQKYDVYATTFVIGYYYGSPMAPIDNIFYESHTYNMHRGGCKDQGHGGIFNCISYEEGIADLKKSIEVIGDNKAIAYPYGDVNNNIKKITKDAGFQLGFTTVGGRIKPGMDKLALPRVRISGGISIEEFAKRVS